MVALPDDFYGLGAGVPVVLTAAEQVERAYGNRDVGLLFESRYQRAHHGILIGFVG